MQSNTYTRSARARRARTQLKPISDFAPPTTCCQPVSHLFAYIYDLRASGGAGGREALWKLRGHADTVVDVCFSPVYPQLATVCASGKLNFFCDGE